MKNAEANELNDRCSKEMALAMAALSQFQHHWEKACKLFVEQAKVSENRDCEQYQIIAQNTLNVMNHVGLKSCEIEGLLVTRAMGQMIQRGMFLLEVNRFDPESTDKN